MRNDINHQGQDDPRHIARLLTLPVPCGLENLSSHAKAVFNLLRHRAGWDKDHHGYVTTTISKAIGLDDAETDAACGELVSKGVAEFEYRPHGMVCRLGPGFTLKSRSVMLDPDIAEYIEALVDREFSRRDIANWMLAEFIARDTKDAAERRRQGPAFLGGSSNCSLCQNSREALEWKDGVPVSVPCPACTITDNRKPVNVGGVGHRHSGQPPVIPLYE